MEFIQLHQLDIMLFMSGVCGILTFMTLITSNVPNRKKSILTLMEAAATLLMFFERFSYIYRGNTSIKGYYMVRISNAFVFFLILLIPYIVSHYLRNLCKYHTSLKYVPFCLKLCDIPFIIGTVLIVITQFTGLYYSFNDHNVYVRSSHFTLSYIFPMTIILLQIITIIQYRNVLIRWKFVSLLISISLPTFMSFLQIFYYGISLTSMSLVFVVMIFHIFELKDLSKEIDHARENELNAYKESERKEIIMFEETAEALAGAIDAKDEYTRGHSARVAVVSRQIAEKAGFDDKMCHLIYFSALLHDIGKIGVKDEILNKKGKLTNEEFEQIKMHTIYGYQILSSIKQSPMLNIGAHYHHEKYDGSGYPDGLSGENIPEIARIIAVADAYDAMSSTRSYRNALPFEKIKSELINGKNKQFDARFVDLLLEIIQEN